MTTNNAINTYIAPDTNNQVLMPSQPAFFAYLGTSDANVTGDGTTYQLGSGNALTEIYDQNSDFNVNGTFTAPVTGRYALAASILSYNVAAHTTQLVEIVTSNRTYVLGDFDPSAMKNSSNYCLSPGEIFADMDSADTATVEATVSGGALTVGILASSGNSNFQGALIC